MKRFLSIMLVVCLLAALAVPVGAVTTASGSCGSNLAWTLDDEGVLSITGSGPMTAYTSSSKLPWSSLSDSIKTVIVGEGVTTISQYAFYEYPAVNHVIISDTVTDIGNKAFYNCSALLTVSIGDGVTDLGTEVFSGCKAMLAVSLGSGLKEIPSKTFNNCTLLTHVFYNGTEKEWGNVTVGSGNANIKEDAEDLMYYGAAADSGSCGSTTWTFDHETFTLIISGEGAMADYSLDSGRPWQDYANIIRTVKVEDGVTTIGTRAFRYLKNLNTMQIGTGVKQINAKAFNYCSALTDIYYGGVEAAWNNISVGTDNEMLQSADIHFADECQHSVVGEVWTSNGNETHTLKVVCDACGEVFSSVTSDCSDESGDYKCEICGGSVGAPESGDGTQCVHDEEDHVYLTNGDGLYHTKWLKCTECGYEEELAVENCTDENMDSVCDVCSGAIEGGTGGEETECTHANTETVYEAVDGKNHNVKTVCTACEETVSETSAACTDSDKNYVCDVCEADMEYISWSYNATTGVLTIKGRGPMADYASGSKIPWYSVRSNIKRVVIEEGVTHIGNYAFYYCASMRDATIPVSVTSIGSYAFRGCSSLESVIYGGTDAQWAAISFGANNTNLTDATVSTICDHTDLNQTVTANADKTHTVEATCNGCGTVMDPVTEACTEGESVCTAGEGVHTLTTKCAVCEQTLEEESVVCTETTETVVCNNNRTHTVTVTCNTCGGTVSSETVSCADGEEADGSCDVCGFDLACDHPAFVRAYRSNGDHETHNYGFYCEVCGEEDTVLIEKEACSGEDGVICDSCGQDYSCQHNEEDLRTETEHHATTKTEVYTHNQMTVVYCDGEDCDLTDRIYSSTFVEEQNCADADGDDECDLCGRNMVCSHADYAETVTHNGRNTHQYKAVCNICGDTLQDVEMDCVYGVLGGACAMCKNECGHEYTYTYNQKSDVQQHYTEAKCDYCGYELGTATENCADTEPHDGLCDACGGAVACDHAQKVAYEAGENGTHTVVKTCDTCATQEDSCNVCAAYWAVIEGEKCTDGEDEDTLCDNCDADFAEATVNTVAYATFAEALTAAQDSDTITVLKDITVSDAIVVSNMELTIVGNDATMTFDITGDDSMIACDGMLILGEGLTVKSDKALLWAYEGGEIVVDGADLETTNTEFVAVLADDSSVITVNSGSIRSANNTMKAKAGGKIVINGGTVECTADETAYLCTVWNAGGELEITGGNVLGSNTSAVVSADNGTVSISGGVFSTPVKASYCAEGYEPCDNGDGTYGVQSAKVNVAGSNMTLGNDLKMNFMVKTAELQDGLTMRVTQDGKDPVVLTPEKYNSTYHYVAYSVAAKEMTDVLTVEVLNADGYVISEPYTRTIAYYATNLLTKSTSTDKLKSVAVDMLNYGTEAQKYFSYNEDDYANANISAEDQTAYATTGATCDVQRILGTNAAGTNLSLEASILLNVFFNSTTTDGMTATVTYTNYKGAEVTAEAAVEKYGSSRVKVVVDEIVLADTKRPVTVTVYKDGAEYGSCTEAVGGYATRKLEDSTMGSICQAILNFATSAYTYLGGTN